MFKWMPYPFVRIVFSFVAGILVAIRMPDFIPWGVACWILFLTTIAAISCMLVNAVRKRVIINPGLVALSSFFFLGYVNVLYSTDAFREDHLLHLNHYDAYTAVVVTSHEPAKSSWKQLVEVRKVLMQGKWVEARGKVLLYYDTTTFPSPFRYGEVLAIKGAPSLVAAPANPHVFDYRRFLAYRNIYHQHFIRDAQMGNLGYEPPSRVMDFAIKTRLWAGNILCDRISGRDERAIVMALVLGVTDGLDAEITGAYAASGAMHVLAVSGLHVGIIYLILGTVLKPLRRLRGGKWILTIVSLTVLWGYACVAGLSPSVLRAVTMFSFVAAGQPLGYRTNIYNTLAASAFFLLLFNPYLIMAVGFQLSYVAVVSIVYFHPLLYNILEPNSRFLDHIWNISAVSISAQLGTFSIGLFYFHQFPTYFLISNLFVIPLAFCVLVGGLFVIVVHNIPVVGMCAGIALEGIIRLLNYLIFQVERLPFSVIDGISLTLTQCVLLAAIVAVAALFMQYRKFHYAIFSLMLLIGYGAEQWIRHAGIFVEPRLVVYQVSRHQVVDIIKGGIAYSFSDSGEEDHETAIGYQVSPNRLALRVSRVIMGENQAFVRNFRGGAVIRWEGKTILLLRELSDEFNSIKVDYLVLSGSAIRNLPAVLKKINADNIILDSSNSYFVTDKALKSLTETVQIHSVWHHGAFDVNW